MRHAGAARWAYNWGLRLCMERHERWRQLGRPKKWAGWLSGYDLQAQITQVKATSAEDGGAPWLAEVGRRAYADALLDLDVAFKNFLAGRGRYPRFKSRSRGIGGFRAFGAVVEHDRIRIPKIGWLRIQPGQHGYAPCGKTKLIRIRESAGRWFATWVAREAPEPEPSGPAVGCDVGVAQLATLSDGTVYDNPRALARAQRKLKRLQREVSRKKKGSANRRKAVARLARVHRRVRNVRQDALHRVTTDIAKTHGLVAIEDLKVRNMTRRGRGKRGLNRQLADASFGEFRRQLTYKGALYGCQVVAVPPHYTSQRCAECGHTEKANRPSQAEFRCRACGHEAHADVNAARNILVAAKSTETENACGGHVSPEPSRPRQSPVKQEASNRAQPGVRLADGAREGVTIHSHAPQLAFPFAGAR